MIITVNIFWLIHALTFMLVRLLQSYFFFKLFNINLKTKFENFIIDIYKPQNVTYLATPLSMTTHKRKWMNMKLFLDLPTMHGSQKQGWGHFFL